MHIRPIIVYITMGIVTDKNMLLLKTNMEFGHGGASGRFDYLKEVALNYSFLFKLEGISK